MTPTARHLSLALAAVSTLAVQPLAVGAAPGPEAGPAPVVRPLAGTLGCPNGNPDDRVPARAAYGARGDGDVSVLASLPPYQTWMSEVVAVVGTADRYLAGRLPAAGQKTAVVLDIDNTSLESSYARGTVKPAVRPVLDVALKARAAGASIIFITSRQEADRTRFETNLSSVGYPIDALHMRPAGDTSTCQAYKTRTRTNLEQLGYTIVANIGNNRSDLDGGHAERTFKLPDYDGQLY